MQRVGAALHRHVDRRPSRVALLRVVGRRLDLELLHRVGGRDVGDAPSVGVVGRAVEGELVAPGGPVGDDRRGPRVVERAGELEVAGVGRARREPGQDERVAVRERQAGDPLGVDHLARGPRSRLEKRRAGHDLDQLGDPAGLELEVQRQAVADADLHGPAGLLEAHQLGGHRVLADGKVEQVVVALRVGSGRDREVRRLPGGDDGGPGHYCARRVGHGARDGAARLLGRRKPRREDQAGRSPEWPVQHAEVHAPPPGIVPANTLPGHREGRPDESCAATLSQGPRPATDESRPSRPTPIQQRAFDLLQVSHRI